MTKTSPASYVGRRVLGGFRLLDELAQGSFATAYLADQIWIDRKAVVKIAHAHLIHSPRGKVVRERFAAEVRAATRVKHPNLITIYTAGETDDGLPAMAMEHLEGKTLGQRLRSGERLTIDELCRTFTQLASALVRVHASRIIHRDVSPGNVFLTRGHDGFTVKLLDFGLARLEDLATGTCSSVGTPFYVAPEQLRGTPSPASDVYSVGALLWWCLTGKELFEHITQLAQLIFQLETQREPPDARTVCPTLPARAAALVESMLHHDPSRRPTMSEFIVAWRELDPELRQWWGRAQTPRRVAALMGKWPAGTPLVNELAGAGHTVLQPAPRAATLLAEPSLDAIVIDAEMTDPNPLSLARHLEQILPDVPIIAVSTRPFSAAWEAAPVRARLLLPEQLAKIHKALTEDAPSSAMRRLASGAAQRALGEVPELLANLEACVEDRESAIYLCERIECVAHLASLDDVRSLARTLRVLLEEHAVDTPSDFVKQLTSSFSEAFPALLLAAQET
jgi:tRNA A-37 threonylcarbamoyl transferase component Bud32/CheY-like chemotaxis protein